MTSTCEVCKSHPGWLTVAVVRTSTGPGTAQVCGPCGFRLQDEGRAKPLEAAP